MSSSTRRAWPDISQNAVNPKLAKYLSLQHRDPALVRSFKNSGFCVGFTSLALAAKWLDWQEMRIGPDKKLILRDDWEWLERNLIKISEWDEKLSSLNKADIQTFERIISLIEYYQNPTSYQPSISQEELHKSYEDTRGRHLTLEYTLAGMFTEDDFTYPIRLKGAKSSTTLIDQLFKEDRLIMISSITHATGLILHNDIYYFYDANDKRGWQTFTRQQAKALLHELYISYLYDDNDAHPLSFRIFTFDNKTFAYPAQTELLMHLTSEPQKTDKKFSASGLHIAAQIGCVNSINYYLNEHANVNTVDFRKQTPLHYAVAENRVSAVKLLLGAGTNPNLENDHGETALNMAAQLQDKTILLLLKKYGADFGSALFNAAAAGKRDTVLILLRHHADPNYQSPGDLTPLLAAIINNRDIKIIQDLCVENANTNYIGLRGEITPLISAVVSDDAELARLLIKFDADVNLQTANGTTPLHAAVRYYNNDDDIIKLLIDRHANINLADTLGETPFTLAIKNNEHRIVLLMLESNQDITHQHLIEALSGLKLKHAWKLIEDIDIDTLSLLMEKTKQDFKRPLKLLDEYRKSYNYDPSVYQLLLFAAARLYASHYRKKTTGKKPGLFDKPEDKRAAATLLQHIIKDDSEETKPQNKKLLDLVKKGTMGEIYQRFKAAQKPDQSLRLSKGL